MSNFKQIVIAVSLCFSSVAFGGEHYMSSETIQNDSSSVSKSSAGAVGIGVGGVGYGGIGVGGDGGNGVGVSSAQGGSVGFSGNSTVNSTTGGNKVNANPVIVNQNNTKVPRQVGALGLSTPMSTAQCRHAFGGGIGGGTFSFLFNGTFLDEGCDIWRDVENLQNLGDNEAAFIRACDKPEIAAAIAKREGKQCPVKGAEVSKSKEWSGGES